MSKSFPMIGRIDALPRSRCILTSLLVASTCCTSGCMQYLVQAPAPSVAGSPQTIHVNSYAGGTVQQPPYVLADKCREGEQLARVLVRRNAGQGLISWLSFGLYTPATVIYECANANDPGLGLSGSGQNR